MQLNSKSNLSAVYGYLLAWLTVVSSATAVNVIGTRLSDISFGLMCLLMVIVAIFFRRQNIPREASWLFFYLFIDSLVYAIVRQYQAGGADYQNAVFIPVALLSTLFFWTTTSKIAKISFLRSYGPMLLAVSLGVYCFEYVSGRAAWIEILDETDRYSALSQNPNQLALFLLPAPFFSLALWRLGEKKLVPMIAEIGGYFLLNTLIFGKALFAAWLLGFSIMIFLGIATKEKWTFKAKHAVILFCLGIFSLLVVIPIAAKVYEGDAPGSIEGQGIGRVILWMNGLSAWLDAPILGHGPGHYSGIFAPYDGTEAHNLIVDWLSAYGLIGVLFLIAFFVWALKTAYVRGVWISIALYAVLITQSVFHFYARQPVYWLWWFLGVFLAVELRMKVDKEMKDRHVVTGKNI